MFEFKSTDSSGLTYINGFKHVDVRGSFQKLYSNLDFSSIAPSLNIKQVNLSSSKGAGSIRGMHYQLTPYTEEKIVSCIHGLVFDVVVDLRRGSKTFLEWRGFYLDSAKQSALYIPVGFAHGFQVISESAQLLYLHGREYMPHYEGAINPFDPLIKIEWPLRLNVISEKDATTPNLKQNFEGLDL